ncbi:MAG: hypothetical protein R3C56_27740 [Pirellulaceae bacterium]
MIQAYRLGDQKRPNALAFQDQKTISGRKLIGRVDIQQSPQSNDGYELSAQPPKPYQRAVAMGNFDDLRCNHKLANGDRWYREPGIAATKNAMFIGSGNVARDA